MSTDGAKPQDDLHLGEQTASPQAGPKGPPDDVGATIAAGQEAPATLAHIPEVNAVEGKPGDEAVRTAQHAAPPKGRADLPTASQSGTTVNEAEAAQTQREGWVKWGLLVIPRALRWSVQLVQQSSVPEMESAIAVFIEEARLAPRQTGRGESVGLKKAAKILRKALKSRHRRGKRLSNDADMGPVIEALDAFDMADPQGSVARVMSAFEGAGISLETTRENAVSLTTQYGIEVSDNDMRAGGGERAEGKKPMLAVKAALVRLSGLIGIATTAEQGKVLRRAEVTEPLENSEEIASAVSDLIVALQAVPFLPNGRRAQNLLMILHGYLIVVNKGDPGSMRAWANQLARELEVMGINIHVLTTNAVKYSDQKR